MKAFKSVKSKVMPLALKNIDTDMIIPAQFLTSISREGYAENLFRRLRDQDSNFPLNKQEFQTSKILCVDENFGCGSSREHAVWALMGAGFQVVISKSFADIFASNASKNGLVLLVLDAATVDEILIDSLTGAYELEVNLETQQVILPTGISKNFTFDAFRKHCILNGLDDLEYILSHKNDILSYWETRKNYQFFKTTELNHTKG
jgi:3-isopropylmalate/(R)-2-methylmalate dehydratase small subunit